MRREEETTINGRSTRQMKFERRFSPEDSTGMCVCEEIAVCVSTARVEESESRVSWIKSGFVGPVYQPRARDATRDVDGANFAAQGGNRCRYRAGAAGGGCGREVARGTRHQERAEGWMELSDEEWSRAR